MTPPPRDAPAADRDERDQPRGDTVVLHDTESVFSARHFPSWMLLAFAAGGVNAGALLACHRFVTHVTGTATQIGVDAGKWRLMADYLIVLACFVLGAMTSVWLINARQHRGRRPLYWAPLAIVAVVLVGVAVAGRLGAFGPFGMTVETTGDFVLLSLLSAAMGLQNASIATSTGMMVRTTHMTGPASDLGVSLATLMYADGAARRDAWRSVALRGGKLTAFIVGGVAMVHLCHTAQYLAFLMPAVTCVVACVRSYAPGAVAEPRAPSPHATTRAVRASQHAQA